MVFSRPKVLAALAVATLMALAYGENSRSAAKTPQAELASGRAPVTFDRDIAPLLFKTCAPCHHPGESAPFSLLTYGDAKSHARQIVYITRKRIMPPWLPGPGDYPFADDDHLSDGEIAAFQKWVDDGLLEGDATELPPAPKFAPGWQLGKPDLILRAERPYRLPASGRDQYWNFVFRTPLHETRWVKAIEIHPAAKRLVHHANLLIDRAHSARRQEKFPGSGFPGMELQIESETFDPDGHFFFWKPGTILEPEPGGMALRLDPGDDLVLNTHLQPSGKPEEVQPSIGIYFTKQAASLFPVLLQLENDRALEIPAGDRSFVVTDEFTLPEPVDLLAIYPHAHYVCTEMFAYANFPDGEKKTLLHIPRWDQNWQAVFRYKQAIPLPQGTTLSMRYVYDNSSENIFNPNNPPKMIRAGNLATDEMAHLWLQVLPHAASGQTGDPRMPLLEALARHHVERNPEDFAAHYNLAALLETRGDFAGAIPLYEDASRLRPGDATVENALGGALLAAGQLREAVLHLRAAAKARPDYFDAHYNLGNALASMGDYAGAATEFGEAVRLNPADAGAHGNFGSALALTGKVEEAKREFQKALELNPNDKLARENLESLQSGSSKP